MKPFDLHSYRVYMARMRRSRRWWGGGGVEKEKGEEGKDIDDERLIRPIQIHQQQDYCASQIITNDQPDHLSRFHGEQHRNLIISSVHSFISMYYCWNSCCLNNKHAFIHANIIHIFIFPFVHNVCKQTQTHLLDDN